MKRWRRASQSSSTLPSRRSILGAAALAGFGAPALSGCSALQNLPFLGAEPDPFSRIDPAVVPDTDIAFALSIKPAQLAQDIGLDRDAGVPERFQDFVLEMTKYTTPIPVFVTWERVSANIDQVADLMFSSPLTVKVHDVFTVRAEDAENRDAWMEIPTLIRSDAHVLADEGDLIFSMADDPSAFLDTGSSYRENFVDLDDMVEAADIDQPHAVAIGGGSSPIMNHDVKKVVGELTQWWCGMRAASATDVTVKGVVRASGDVDAIAETIENAYRDVMRVSAPQGDLIALEITGFGQAQDATPLNSSLSILRDFSMLPFRSLAPWA